MYKVLKLVMVAILQESFQLQILILLYITVKTVVLKWQSLSEVHNVVLTELC